jgi:hypothetical protein
MRLLAGVLYLVAACLVAFGFWLAWPPLGPLSAGALVGFGGYLADPGEPA